MSPLFPYTTLFRSRPGCCWGLTKVSLGCQFAGADILIKGALAPASLRRRIYACRQRLQVDHSLILDLACSLRAADGHRLIFDTHLRQPPYRGRDWIGWCALVYGKWWMQDRTDHYTRLHYRVPTPRCRMPILDHRRPRWRSVVYRERYRAHHHSWRAHAVPQRGQSRTRADRCRTRWSAVVHRYQRDRAHHYRRGH